jgi:opacity protein-like surface antigen
MSKSSTIVLAGMLVLCAAAAEAQTTASLNEGRYVEFIVGVTAGHATGAVLGGEFGWPLNLSWDVFVEGGRMLNTRTAGMDAAATTISNYLADVAGSTSYQAKQPVTYFDGGVRYKFPTAGRFDPYAEGAIGVARVSRNVTFSVNGVEQTAQQLDDFGVQLGTDLSGHETKAYLTLGVGARFRLFSPFYGDVSYRYGHVYLSDAGLNTNRLQFGAGLRF